jgi:hypothetical protein
VHSIGESVVYAREELTLGFTSVDDMEKEHAALLVDLWSRAAATLGPR